MPPPFSQLVFENATQPPYYLYLQPGAPTPPALAPQPPLPSQPPQQQPQHPRGRCMHIKARLILLLPKIRGKTTKTNLPQVIQEPIPKGIHLRLLTSNMELSPSRTGLFARTNLVLFVVSMVTILMIVLFYLRCDRCGKLKQHPEDSKPPLRFLPMLPLSNYICLPILSSKKDSWLPNTL